MFTPSAIEAFYLILQILDQLSNFFSWRKARFNETSSCERLWIQRTISQGHTLHFVILEFGRKVA